MKGEEALDHGTKDSRDRCDWLKEPLWQRRRLLGVNGRWRLERRHLITTPLAALFLFLIDYLLDPFNLDAVTERYSRTLFYQLTADLYDDRFQDDITIVLTTEKDLPNGWPTSYAYHADLLEAILDYRPKALFVDVAFIDPERQDPTLDALVEVLTAYREQGVPVYLARGQADTRLPDGVLPQLLAGEIARPVAVPGAGYGREGVIYPLTEGEGRARACSAAQALFADVRCQEERPPMHITWSLFQGGEANGPFRCRERVPESVGSRVLATLRHMIPFLRRDESDRAGVTEDYLRQTCPPHPTIRAGRFWSANSDAGWEALENRIRGRYVLYGAFLDMSNDLVTPPTHRAIPGIYYHAMALDNLLLAASRNEPPVHEQDPLLPGIETSDLADLVVLLLMLIICDGARLLVFGASFQVASDAPLASRVRVKVAAFAYVTLFCVLALVSVILVIVVTTLFLFYGLRQPPPDFVGLAGLVGLEQIMPGVFRVWERWKRHCCLFQ